MRIAVLIKYVPDTEEPRFLDERTGLLDRDGGDLDEINSRALSWALETKRTHGGEVIAVTMGPADATEATRRALAIGADEAVHVEDDALSGADALTTAAVLAAALRTIGFDIAVAGDMATDGHVGAVPAMIAEHLGIAHVTYVSQVEVDGRSVRATRDEGTTSLEITAELPAIVSVTEVIAEPEVPSFRGIMGAKRKPKRTLTLADVGVTVTPGAWSTVNITPKPERTAGDIITDDGTAARRIADLLAEHHLIGKARS